jgi:hypothetical protein
MRRIAQLSLIILTTFSLFAGCSNREVARVDPTQNSENLKVIPVDLNRDIDLLFVIDNSGSMDEEQQSLTANFQRFISVLENIEGGLPNVHIGVISTDTGAGQNPGTGCSPQGDNGQLRVNGTGPATATCGVDASRFIVDIENENGGRQQNYDPASSLAETFSCVATLGITGCGFEQPLESMKRALSNNPQNTGFLRENAFLAVIFVTDEDDCSVSDTRMFDTSQNDINAPLGPLSSFRCFEFGVQCEPDEARTPGPRQNCVPRDDSQYMTRVSEYVDFLKTVKSDPNQLIVAGIIGNPSPTVVGIDTNNNNIPKLAPSCTSASGEAAPSTRLKYFLDQFPQRNTVTTICNENLEDALIVIAELLKKVIGNPCLEGNIDTRPDVAGVQYDCQVSDVRFPNQDNQEEYVLPNCDSPGATAPCWTIQENTAQCPDTETQQELIITRNSDPLSGTSVVARCVVN